MAADESLPGASRMILAGQIGSFHGQIFYPTGPLLSPERTLAPGSMSALHSGISMDRVYDITADFQSGGLHWFSPQDEVRMQYMRKLLANNNARGYFQICGTQAHPPNSVQVSPTDVRDVEAGYLMADEPWSRTVDNPENGLRGEQFNVPQMMHDRMLHKAMMPNPLVVTEAPSAVLVGAVPWEARDPTPGFDRPQTDASVRATAFGVQRQVPWPKAGMGTMTAGGVPYTPGLHTSPGTAAMAAKSALSGNRRGKNKKTGPLPAAKSYLDPVTGEWHAGAVSGVDPKTGEVVAGYVHPTSTNLNAVASMIGTGKSGGGGCGGGMAAGGGAGSSGCGATGDGKHFIQHVMSNPDYQAGAFTREAADAGYSSPIKYARVVLADPSKHSLVTRHRAQFLVNMHHRAHQIGSGWFDTIKSAASAAVHQVTDPNSTLRSKILPNAGKALETASKVAKAVAPDSKVSGALDTAKGYADTAQKANEGAQKLGYGKSMHMTAKEADEAVGQSKGAHDVAQSEGMMKAHREHHTNLKFGEVGEPAKRPVSDADKAVPASEGGQSAAPVDFMADQARQRMETIARVRDAEVAAHVPLDQSSAAVRHLHENFGDLRDPSNLPSPEYIERYMRPTRMFRKADGYQMPPAVRARESESDKGDTGDTGKELKGGAWWDALDPAKNGVSAAFNSAGAAIKHEFEDPSSKLRSEIVPAIGHEFTDKSSDLRAKILPGAATALAAATASFPALAPLAAAAAAAQTANKTAASIGFGKGDASEHYPQSLKDLLERKKKEKGDKRERKEKR